MPSRIRRPSVRPGSEAVHVDIIKRQHNGKLYSYPLLRQSFRQDGKVKHRTLANLSSLPADAIELIRGALAGQRFAPRDQLFQVERSFPHGHVAAVLGSISKLKIDSLFLAPSPGDLRQRALVKSMIASQILEPASKLSSVGFMERTGLLGELGIEGQVDQDDLYGAMDWLLGHQEMIERRLADRHLTSGGLCLYDRSSAIYTGEHCELAERGYSRDGVRNSLQVTFGLTCDAEGRPVAIKVDAGSVGDPKTVGEEIEMLRRRFKLKEVVLVGDRGTLTKARIEELKKLPGVGWISALRGPAIRKLANQGSIQLSLFDQRNLAEITSPEYPGERLIVCLNPHVAEKRARTRIELLDATEKALVKVVERVAAGRLVHEDRIGEQVGRVCNRYKVAKHFEWAIGKGKFSFSRKQDPIDQEAALDGIYVIRTQLPAEAMEAAQVVRSYKRLARVESNFRVIKGPDLQVAPIRHRLTERIRAHFLICLLADYVRWHMERELAPLLFKDEAVPFPEDPVAPAQRSNSALRKVRRKHNAEDLPVSSFRGLLDELATLTKNLVVAGGNVRFFQMTSPTPLHQRAFQLLDLKLPVAKKPLLSAS